MCVCVFDAPPRLGLGLVVTVDVDAVAVDARGGIKHARPNRKLAPMLCQSVYQVGRGNIESGRERARATVKDKEGVHIPLNSN